MQSSASRPPLSDRERASCRIPTASRAGITDIGEIGRARAGAEMLKQRVVARIGPQLSDDRVLVVQVAEGDCPRRTGALTGGLDFIDADRAVVALGGAAARTDAL